MFTEIRDSVLGVLEGVLGFLHDVFEPLFGLHSWGWSIIALTLIVRVLLLPLAIKQTRSMRAMQAIQPQMKALQKKYKVDRELMKKDPEQYKAKKAKLNEEMMALYREEGANPAASCLPLLAQAPIFLALFWTLNLDRQEVFNNAPFYFFTEFVSAETRDQGVTGLATQVSQAGWPGWALILLMSGTMYWSQRQMMARTAMAQGDGGSNPMAQQQKIMLYAMPVFLAVISFQFPLGILLYWVTTNVWQVAQQAIILREVQAESAAGTLKDKPGGEGPEEAGGDAAGPPRRSPGASSGTKPVPKDPKGKDPKDAKGPKDKGPSSKGAKGKDGASSTDGKQAPKKGKGKSGTGKDRHRELRPSAGEDGGAPSKKDGRGSRSKGPEGDAGSPSERPTAGSDKADSDDSKPTSNGSRSRRDGSSNGGETDPSGTRPSRPAKRDHLPRRPRR